VLVQRRRELFEKATDRLRDAAANSAVERARTPGLLMAYHPIPTVPPALLTLAQVGQAVAAAQKRGERCREFAPPMLSFRHARRLTFFRIGLTVPRNRIKTMIRREDAVSTRNIYAMNE